MFKRTIWSTMVLSGAVASAIALAQSPDKADSADEKGQESDLAKAAARTGRPLPATSAATESAPKAAQQDQLYLTPVPGPHLSPGIQPTPGATTNQVYYSTQMHFARALSPEEQAQAKEFRDAVEQLRRAKTTEEKSEARERLNEIVGEQLERDLQEREKKLAEIETRAKELRDQLEQRRSSKAEMQKMLLMLIESPEAGLGLPPAWLSSLMQPGPSMTPMYSLPPGSTLSPAPTLPQGSTVRPSIGPPTATPSQPFPTAPARAPSDPFSAEPARAPNDPFE